MNTTQVIRELEAQRARLDAALEALRTLDGHSANGRRKRRRVSAEARRRMSEAQKKRWATTRHKKK
jgi:hypothetical protein